MSGRAASSDAAPPGLRRNVAVAGTAAALYSVASFALLVRAGFGPLISCAGATVAGIAVAFAAARLLVREQSPEKGSTRAQSVRPRGSAPAPKTSNASTTSKQIPQSANSQAAAATSQPAVAQPNAPTPDTPAPEAIAKRVNEQGFAIRESRETRESREIQASLLPRTLPEEDGYCVEVLYEPCGALGGDFYDFIPLGDGRTLLTLGDVSGKGPAGAIVMAMVQTLFRQQAPHSSGPAELLRRVNDGFAGAVGKGIFVTALACILDTREHRFVVAGAGHHPLLLMNPHNRSTTQVSARGLALGLVTGNSFADALVETTIDLAAGDSLLLYTDGATECDDDVADGMGESRFLAAAAASILGGPRDALQRVANDLWIGSERHDDITLLMVSRLAGRRGDVPDTDRSEGGVKI